MSEFFSSSFHSNCRKTLLLVAGLTFSTTTFSQKVFRVEYVNQAYVKVYEVEFENQADLKVFKVDYQNQAENCNGLWFETDFVNQADWKIFEVEFQNQADLKIYYVKFRNQAGWANDGKKHLICGNTGS